MRFNYLLIFFFLLFSLFLAILIYLTSFLIIKSNSYNEKLSAYECGFNPYEDARKSFDIKFYLIAILFMIFDLEAVFIFPWALTIDSNFILGFWTMIEFLYELIIGYVYIWFAGALEWE